MEYREFRESDELRLAEIIRDTWEYKRLSDNEEVALLMGKIYLYSCLVSQNYNLVAVEKNYPVGIIMGNINEKSKMNYTYYKSKLEKYYEEMQKYDEGKFILKLFAGFEQVDNDMLKEIGKTYDGELVFFVTDIDFRGYHVGTALYQNFLGECEKYHCKNLYVYTDATCNYGFYEHKGFVRMNQRYHKVCNEEFEFYVYEKEIT